MTARGREHDSAMPWWGALVLTGIAVAATRLVVLGSAALRASRRGVPVSEGLQDVAVDPLALGLAQGAGFVAAIWIGLRWFARDVPLRPALRIEPVRPTILALSVVAGLALQFPLAELGNMLRELDPLSVQEQLRIRRLLMPDGAVDGIAIVLALVLVAPLAEELLFRGLVLPSLAARYRAGVAIGLSAVLFGASHVDPVMIAYATAAGLVLATVAVRTGSTLPAVAMHAAINAVPVMLPERLVRIRGFNTVNEDVYHLPLPLLAGSGLVAVAALAALLRLSDAEST